MKKYVKNHVYDELLQPVACGICIYVINEKGPISIQYTNEGYCRMCEGSRQEMEEAYQRDPYFGVGEEDKERVCSFYNTILSQRKDSEITYHAITLKGNSRWCTAKVSFAGTKEDAEYVYITYFDVTEQMDIERQYQQQINAMEQLDAANLIAKGRSNITRNRAEFHDQKWKDAIDFGTGQSFDKGIASVLQKVVSEEEKTRIKETFCRQQLQENFRNGVTEGAVTYRRFSADGRFIYCETRFGLKEEPATHDLIMFAYTYDITEAVMGEQIIQKIGEVEYDLLGLLDVRTGIYTVKNINKKFKKVSVYEEKGDFSDKCKELTTLFVAPEEREEVSKKLSLSNIVKQLEDKPLYEFAYTSILRSTQRRNKIQFTYLDEFKTTILYSKSNITAIYEHEREQLRQTEQALVEAKRANLAKSDFFARMSHDMRTPMNGILGMTELSKEVTDVEELHHNLEMIESSGKYMLNLINDILDLQKLESGKLEIRPEIIKCNAFIENIVDMMRPTAQQKQIDFQMINKNIDLDRYARFDVLRLKQIFVNLMSNAVKFTPEGGKIVFTMENTSQEPGMDHDKFQIIDSGIGMSEDFLEHEIFNPYSQEHNTSTTQYAGSGLGLAITKSLVELMGGSIEVESEPGAGTTFTMHMDVEMIEDKLAAAELAKGNELQTLALDTLYGKKGLVCEDHPLNAEIAKRLLEKAGCIVTLAANGQEGVDRFTESENGYFDFILMDIRMPYMDGLEATKRIRQLERADAGQVPIIAMTANAFEEDIHNSMEAGMNAHLAKPINPAEVYKTLIRFM